MAVVLTMHVCSDSDMALPPAPAAMATEPSCCMCNCKSTLQAILLELRTMRKLIQTQRGKSYITTLKLIWTQRTYRRIDPCSAVLSGTQDKQGSQGSLSSSRACISRRRTRKRRPGHRVTLLATATKKSTPLSPTAEVDAVNECNQSREDTPSTLATFIPDPIPSVKTPPSHYSITRGQSTTEVHHCQCMRERVLYLFSGVL